MGIPDYLTCLLRNLYAGQEATVRTGHEMMDWFKTEKVLCQACILPCIFNLYAEYIMPDWMKHKLESRLPGDVINNLRYVDDTTLMEKSEEKLKSLLMKVKEESEAQRSEN